ncbi:DUF4232 domain-containing protein [Spirillospora sp. NPDC047279]|uniref:DUF4232 domain-containing protein n=1 Tax=Spirillospora sp. NPDC047279 TaxID=3155478 RepID=UPI0033CED9B3
MRRTTWSLALALLLVGACDSTPSADDVRLPPTTPPAPAPAACPDPGVRISTGEIDAAMGLRAMNVEMVNCGTRPFTVNGYPDVRVLDGRRGPLKLKISHGSAPVATVESFNVPAQRFVLPPGGRATSGLLWRNTVTDASAVAANGAFLDIAPDERSPRQIVPSGHAIDLGNTGRLALSPWKPSKP